MIHYDDDATLDRIYDAGTDDWYMETALLCSNSINTGDRLDMAHREDTIVSCKTTQTLFGNNNPTIGGAVAATMTGQVIEDANLHNPTAGDAVWAVTRFLSTTDSSLFTAWHWDKPFIVDKVEREFTGTEWLNTFTATDAMHRADVAYMRITGRHYWTSDAGPNPTAAELVRDIASLLGLAGITTDTATRLTAQEAAAGLGTLTAPAEETTCRELLCYVAAWLGGNFIIKPSGYSYGALHLVPLTYGATVANVAYNSASSRLGGASPTSDTWDVLLTSEEGEAYAGTPGSLRLEAPCPWVSSPAHALAPLAVVQGSQAWAYNGFTLRDAIADIRIEVGDWIEWSYPAAESVVFGVATMVGSITRTFDHAGLATLSAPDPAPYTSDTHGIT